MSKLSARINRGVARHGETFSPLALESAHRSIRDAYETGARVEVTTTYPSGETYVRRGWVSTTTGWVPAFILMPRRGSSGSGDVLGPNVVTAFVAH